MKNIVLGLGSLVALSACMSGEPATMAADQFIGTPLVAENGTTFLFNADGTVGGEIRNQAVEGTYVSTSTEICSTYSAPEFLTSREYCSTPRVSDGTVVFVRRDGSESAVYTIGG